MTEPTPPGYDPNAAGYNPAGATPPPVNVPLTPADDIQWASFAHLGGIIGFIPSLIIWLMFKDRGAFTNSEAKKALNFQLTALVGYVAVFILASILSVVTFGIGTVLFVLNWGIAIVSIIFSILGFMKAKVGQPYTYPFAIKFIK
ncbi:MAG TPA: DUF4870 domain-containing protein [Candidatus Lumbricidophila sp.]|nr:DUF4870 domain-containing protein [Candidatus Lumbricidophila sp.]